jgi:anaerobic magnesium-protoporphyrin IX monomethyl ester cyclase
MRNFYPDNAYIVKKCIDTMHVLLINVPSRRGKGGMCLPLGLLYVGGILERAGHTVEIFDPYCRDLELVRFDQGDFSDIDEVIQRFTPDIVGFGGIASSYGRTKKLSGHIHEKYPGIFQIAGGPLSSLYEQILSKTSISLVFHGETELTFPHFLETFATGASWQETGGISYKNGDTITRNPLAPQIQNLDEVPFPSYHLVNLKDYYRSMYDIVEGFSTDTSEAFDRERILKKISADGAILPLITSRGCTNKCSFCYRHMKGFRQHSVPYVINHLKYLKSQYGLRGFEFADELFNFSEAWVLEFCDALDREGLDIYYRVLGARVDRMNETMLRRLKETGCVDISYGQESGSEAILKEYRKGVTLEKNREITLLTKDVGLICPVQIVIGSLGETPETIDETIRFLKDVRAGHPSVNYLLAFPETPVWQYITDNGLIPDIEVYLDRVAEEGGSPIVNLTHVPDRIWRSWNFRIKNEVRLDNYRRQSMTLRYVVMYPAIRAVNAVYPYVPQSAIRIAKKILYG